MSMDQPSDPGHLSFLKDFMTASISSDISAKSLSFIYMLADYVAFMCLKLYYLKVSLLFNVHS